MFFYWFIAFIGLNIQHVMSLKCKQKLFGFPGNRFQQKESLIKKFCNKFAESDLQKCKVSAKSIRITNFDPVLPCLYIENLYDD